MTEPTLARIQVPFRTAAAAVLGLRAEEVAPVSVGGRKLHGVGMHPSLSQAIEVPGWVEAAEQWWRIRNGAHALQAVRPDAMLAGESAAYLLRWPVWEFSQTEPGQSGRGVSFARRDIDVVFAADLGRLRRAGFASRRTEFHESIDAHGVRIHRPGLVLLDLMRDSSVLDLLYILDTIMGPWRGPKLATKAQVARMLGREFSKNGRPKLRLALKYAQEDVGSWRETAIRLTIVRAGLPIPTVQMPIVIPELGQTIHPDMVFEEYMVIVEYEGDHHRTDEQQFSYDLQRYYHLEKMGWRVIRVSKRTSMQWLFAELEEVLKQRGWRGEGAAPAKDLRQLWPQG